MIIHGSEEIGLAQAARIEYRKSCCVALSPDSYYLASNLAGVLAPEIRLLAIPKPRPSAMGYSMGYSGHHLLPP